MYFSKKNLSITEEDVSAYEMRFKKRMLFTKFQDCTAQWLRRVKLIIPRYGFSKLPWVISECPAPFVDANIAQGWLQTRLNTGTLVLFCQF